MLERKLMMFLILLVVMFLVNMCPGVDNVFRQRYACRHATDTTKRWGIFKQHHNALGSGENTVMSRPETIDTRLQSPFTALVVGPTGSGKTKMLLSCIANAQPKANPPLVEIDYCYGTWQERFGELTCINFHKGMINVEDRYAADGQNRWLIIDDLADELVGTNELSNFFTKQRHHLNLSVILFQKSLRQVSLNCHYMFLFYNP